MERDMALLWEVSPWEFLFVTLCLGGGAAYMTGRALARGWESPVKLLLLILLLAAAARFIHFALFNGSLLAAQYFVVDYLILALIALAGMRITRARQMRAQYGFDE